MRAIITGASSGLGAEFARQLDAMGYETVLVARREEKLRELAAELSHPAAVVPMDLARPGEAERLYQLFPEADVLINNAGFGSFGAIAESNLNEDQAMIATNITACYTLLKLYLGAFQKQRHGFILNTASAAAFMAGPYFGLYYASKAFVMRASQAAAREVKGSGVSVSALCPGSVATEFNNRAHTTFSSRPLSAQKVVAYALKKMLAGKALIIPSVKIRAAFVMSKLMPESWLTEFSYHTQKKRMK